MSDAADDLPGRLWELWRQGLRPDVAEFLAAAGAIPPAGLVVPGPPGPASRPWVSSPGWT